MTWWARLLVWLRKSDLSAGWLVDRQRHECSRGVDLPCIDWQAMRERDL